MDQLQQALLALQELESDPSTPRNVRQKIQQTCKILSENCEQCLKVSKALAELEPLSSDSNVEAHTRTQLFSIVSLLEVL